MVNGLKLQLIKFKNSYKVVIAMMFLTIFMIFLFSGSSNDSFNGKVGIVDNNKTDISKKFISKLKESDKFTFEVLDIKEAEEKLESNMILTSIILPENFNEEIFNSKSISIKMIYIKEDISDGLIKNLVSQSINLIRYNNNFSEFIKNELNVKNSKKEIESYFKNTNNNGYFKISEETLNSESKKSSVNHTAIGFILFFVSYSIVYGISDILDDIDSRNWHRAIVSPTSRNNLILSSGIFNFFIGLMQIMLSFYLSDIVFKSNFVKHFFSVGIISALYVLSLVGISTFIVGFIKSFKQMDAIMPIALVSMAMLGGCLWPLEIVSSKILLFLSNFTPHKWSIIGLEKIMIGELSILDVINEASILLIIGVVFYSIGLYKINNKVFN